MQTYQVQFANQVRLADIEAALSLVGEFKITVKREKAPKQEREYHEPITFYRDDVEVREMNGIEVERAIRKQENDRAARQRHDGRNKNQFPQYSERLGASDYINRFCRNLGHVPVTYQFGNV